MTNLFLILLGVLLGITLSQLQLRKRNQEIINSLEKLTIIMSEFSLQTTMLELSVEALEKKLEYVIELNSVQNFTEKKHLN